MLQALVRSKERHQRVVSVLLRKEKRKRHKLKELGIDYDFPGYVSNVLAGCVSLQDFNL